MLTEKSWSPPAVSVWALPSFLLESSVLLSEQPEQSEFLANPLRYQTVDVAWWDREAVVLARMSGAVTVLVTQDLTNLSSETTMPDMYGYTL